MKNLANQLKENTDQAIDQNQNDLEKENYGAIEYITKTILAKSKKGTDWETSFTLIKLLNSSGYQIQTGAEEAETLSSPDYIVNHFRNEGLEVNLDSLWISHRNKKNQNLRLTINWSKPKA